MYNRQAILPLILLMLVLQLAACQPVNQPIATSTVPLSSATLLPTLLPTVTSTTASVRSTPTPETCSIEKGKIIKTELPAEMLTWPLRLKIYLPACYHYDDEMFYPVLYLLHGQTATEDQWLDLGIAEIADRLIAAEEIAPMIIVMPYDKSYRQPIEDRFGEAIADILIPYIDGAYRTQDARSGRAIGGLSRGGAWAIHLGLTKPELFASIGAHAPAIFVTDGSKIERWMTALPEDISLRFFVDIGDNDTGAVDALEFEQSLTRYGIEHEWHFYLGAHTDAYWQAHLEEYLRWYAVQWGK